MEDLLSRPRAFRALAELRKSHPEPLSATQLMRATGYFSRNAQALIEDLQAWGLVTTTQRTRGAVRLREIRLTSFGVEVSEHVLRVEAVLASRKRRDQASPSRSRT